MKKIFSVFLLSAFVVLPHFADLPDDPLTFPEADYGHQDNPAYYPYGMYAEWWYFNGQLQGYSTTTRGERSLGFHLSFHQQKFPLLPYDYQSVLSGITDLDNQSYFFASLDNSAAPFIIDTVSTDRLYIHYKDQQDGADAELRSVHKNKRKPAQTPMKVKAELRALTGELIRYDLVLQPVVEPLLVNGGKIDMPGTFYTIPNGEAVYIAKTKLLVCGKVCIGDETIYVNSFRSEAWFDHQYGDFLGSDTTAWEWFSVRLKTSRCFGYDLYGVLYAFVDKTSKEFQQGGASFILPDGEVVHINIGHAWQWNKGHPLYTEEGREFPLQHNITIPELDLDMEITSSVANQYADNLYEGHCHVNAVYQGKAASGFAYKEIVY